MLHNLKVVCCGLVNAVYKEYFVIIYNNYRDCTIKTQGVKYRVTKKDMKMYKEFYCDVL